MPKHLITKIDLCSDNVSLTKGITVLDAVLWIDISWKETKDSTIINCFRIAGFPVVLIIKPEMLAYSQGGAFLNMVFLTTMLTTADVIIHALIAKYGIGIQIVRQEMTKFKKA
jgi:hypothetical protein